MFGSYGRFGDEWTADWTAAWNQPTSDSVVPTGSGEVPYYLAKPEESGQYYTPSSASPSHTAQTVPEGSSVSASDWFGFGKQIVGGLVDIFGRPQQPPPQMYAPPPQPGMPLWGWLALGVGGVVVLGVLARSMKKSSVAGYRRRRSRR